MKILLAVDGSEFTKRMLDYLGAKTQLLSPQNEITALTVVPTVPAQVTHFIDRKSLDEYYSEQASVVLGPVCEFTAGHGCTVRTQWEVGPVADTIARVSHEGGYELLVLGSHGNSALVSFVLGSVVAGVMARCKTPVLIIR